MKCKKCGSENLDLVDSGPHKKLVCVDCLTFQKFLSTKEVEIFEQLKNKTQTSDMLGDLSKRVAALEKTMWVEVIRAKCPYGDPDHSEACLHPDNTCDEPGITNPPCTPAHCSFALSNNMYPIGG